jgi:hypothetical protein
MKLRVAYRLRVVLSLLSVTMLLVSIISAQTTRRNTGKRPTNNVRAANTSRDGTLIICQGVPVPTGYAIIAYLTSTACPHGAYVLKKQDPYSESVATRYAKRHQSTSATQAGDTDVASSNSSGTSQISPSTATPAATSGAGTYTADPFATAPVRNATGAQPVASTPPLSKSTASTRSSDPGLSVTRRRSYHRGSTRATRARTTVGGYTSNEFTISNVRSCGC